MIEVGEYVRTKKKGIFKVLSIRKTPYGYYCGIVDNDNIRTFTIGKGGYAEIKNDIVNHSKNIIDLIEEGDYVNGYFCRYITDINTGEKYLCNYDLNEMQWVPLETIDVWENILTKEQYKANCYKVEEK